MLGLTPAERRGARVLAIVLAIGTLRDLADAHHSRRVPPPEAMPGALAPAGPPPNAGRDTVPRDIAAPEIAPRAALVDLDTATAAELDRLPGIGPVLAARIVEHRRLHGPFRHVDELLSVPGIGPRLLERLRPWLKPPAR